LVAREELEQFVLLKAELERRQNTTTVKYGDQEFSIPWKPQPRQLKFLQACGLASKYLPEETGGKPLARIIGYGGAAGGGKSDSLLAISFLAAEKYPGCNIGYFRREYPQLEGPGGAVMRSQQLFSNIAKWNGSQLRWVFPNGSILEFCHCKSENDVYNYQSQQFDIILFDEGTQFTRSIVRYLLTRNRATVSGIVPFMAIATNPGNVGHVWFKEEFVDAGQPEQPHEVEVEPKAFETHIFIPAKLSDNKILEERDPQYRKSLESQSEDLRRMLLEGDFDVAQGTYFKEWRREIHTIEPFVMPAHWKRYRFLDYGLDMLACYWAAINTQGEVFVYKELYQSDLIISDAAKRIKEVNGNDIVICTYAPPDLWSRRQDTGKSAAETFAINGVPLAVAKNDRVNGWYAVKEWLKPIESKNEQTGEPVVTSKLKIFTNCVNLIRCLPQIQRDEKDSNDVATEPHELTHAPDALRYFCGMRQSPTKSEKKPKGWYTPGELEDLGLNSMEIRRNR